MSFYAHNTHARALPGAVQSKPGKWCSTCSTDCMILLFCCYMFANEHVPVGGLHCKKFSVLSKMKTYTSTANTCTTIAGIFTPYLNTFLLWCDWKLIQFKFSSKRSRSLQFWYKHIVITGSVSALTLWAFVEPMKITHRSCRCFVHIILWQLLVIIRKRRKLRNGFFYLCKYCSYCTVKSVGVTYTASTCVS